jgi:hypothetical protein
MRFVLFALLFFLSMVQTALAAVTINEVAWMGDLTSANHEWIELFNSGGESVSVEGWTLSDGMNLNITLTGSIENNKYAVLERTSDESASGSAFLIYTGALVNTGATLILKDLSGAIIDQVSGGENWQNIGGDNITKETAQYSSQGWVTDIATPGAVNNAGRVVTDTNNETSTTTNESNTATNSGSSNGSSKKNVSESVNFQNTETKMVITPEFQNVAYVNQTVPFKVNMTGVTDKKNKLVKYEWNFGDINATSGKKISHVYKYPGQYLVTVKAVYEKVEQIAQKEITVLPVNFSITRNEEGNILIHNDTAYAVDMSSYILKGDKTVILPPNSVILGKSTITVAKDRVVDNNQTLVRLFDATKNLVTSTNETKLAVSIEEITKNIPPSAPLLIDESVEEMGDTFSPEYLYSSGTVEEVKESEQKEIRWPYFVFIFLILIVLAIIFMSTNKDNSENDL